MDHALLLAGGEYYWPGDLVACQVAGAAWRRSLNGATCGRRRPDGADGDGDVKLQSVHRP
jgi:hypothetical protein